MVGITPFRICALLLSLAATAGTSPATQRSKLASSYPKHRARVGDARRRRAAGMWLTMGSPFSLVSAIVAPDHQLEITGVLKKVNDVTTSADCPTFDDDCVTSQLGETPASSLFRLG